MPNTSSTSSLNQRIHDLTSRAAQEIPHFARRDVTDELQRLIGGRPAAAPAAAKPAKASPGPRRGRRGRRGPNDATIEKVLDFIKTNPGLRSEQIAKQIG